MNSIVPLIPGGGWERLLLDAIWQGVAVGGIAWLIARYGLRQPVVRSWLLFIAITACFVTPLVSWAARERGWALLTSRPGPFNQVSETANSNLDQLHFSSDPQSADTANFDGLMQAAAQVSNSAQSGGEWPATPVLDSSSTNVRRVSDLKQIETTASLPPTAMIRTFFKTLGILWLSVSIVLILRLLISALATCELLRMAEPCQDAEMLAAAALAAKRVGLSVAPSLLVTNKIQTPMVWALGNVRLLAPKLENHCGTNANWAAAFTHELAHVVRGDGWARLWIELVTLAIPLQPLLWILRGKFYIACEEACDDLAVASGLDPVELASALTQWMGRTTRPAILAVSGMSSSKARTLRLLSLRESPEARLSRRFRWLGVAIGLMLVATLAVAQTKTDVAAKPNSDVSRKTSLNDGSETSDSSTSADVERATAEDPLIALYTRRIQEETPFLEQTQADLGAIKSGERQSSAKELQQLEDSLKKQRESLDKYRAKIERRTAELVSRLKETPQKSSEFVRVKPEGPVASRYIIGPPDILELTPVRLISREPIKIQPGDKVQIDVQGTKLEEPIHGIFRVDSSGEIVLGPSYGSVKISGLTRSEVQEAVKTQLEAVLAYPQVALTIDESRVESGIAGKHLVGPDGSINLGVYGTVKVDGKNVEEASKSIEGQLSKWFASPLVSVDVASFNSKVFYVIVSAPTGDNIYRLPLTGHETVLDALAQIPGLTGLSEAKIWIDRPVAGGHEIIPIIWNDALSGAKPAANPQLLPADRLFISGAHLQAEMSEGGSYRPTASNKGDAKSDDAERGGDISADFGAPVVVKTVPEAGTSDVDPNLGEISVTFSRDMLDHSWSWCHTTEASFPPSAGDIRYLDDKRTCVMPVKLEPNKTYNIWFNWPTDEAGYKPRNFKDDHRISAVPYLLVFKTTGVNPPKN